MKNGYVFCASVLALAAACLCCLLVLHQVIMATKGQAFIGWTVGAVGIVLAYSAYKNVGPVSVVTGLLRSDSSRSTIDSGSGARVGSSIAGVTPAASTVAAGPAADRAKALMAGKVNPVWVPIPTQPTMRLDYMAAASFIKVQTEYGKLLPLTGAQRSRQEQADGYARDPGRFAPPGKSGHEFGIAIDLNTNKVDINDPELIKILKANNWFAAGRSGQMHWSWGIPA